MRFSKILLPHVLLAFTIAFVFSPGQVPPVKGSDSLPQRVKPEGVDRLITLNFRDVELRAVIEIMGELTGRNFLIAPDVKGQVTLLSPRMVTVDEAYQILLAVLEVHGYVTVPSGQVVKVVRSDRARTMGTHVGVGKEIDVSEQSVVTQLYRLVHRDATDVSRRLRPLVAKGGLLIPHEDTNTLLIIDNPSNVNRLIKIIEKMEASDFREIRVFPLDHARAEDLAAEVSSILQEQQPAGPARDVAAKIIPDERTNSLIISASQELLSDLENLVHRLDQEMAKQGERVLVYRLEYGVAEEFATLIADILSKTPQAQEAGKFALVSPSTRVLADKGTNSLVIVGTPDDCRTLEEVIQELDGPRPMVYVEAVLVEISSRQALTLGVEWKAGYELKKGGGSIEDKVVLVGSSAPLGTKINELGLGILPEGFFAGVAHKPITFGQILFPSAAALIQAVQGSRDTNILSTPQILTIENQKAVIEVARNVPYLAAAQVADITTPNLVRNVEYRDIGVMLGVTPRVGSDDIIELSMELTLKTLLEGTGSEESEAGPSTIIRSTNVEIAVKDGETVVVAGLFEEASMRNKGETPCLGEVPLLGWLFKRVSDQDEQTSILVFLTPRIIGDPQRDEVTYGRGIKEMPNAGEEERHDELRERLLR